MLFSIFLLCLWFWYCPDNCRLFMMYDRGSIFLNALWFSIDFLSTLRSSTSRVTNYSKLWQHLRKKQDIGDMLSWRKKKTFNSVKCMTKAHTHDAYCLFTQAWHVNCPSDCPITQSNYKHNHNNYNFLKCDWWIGCFIFH